MQGVHMQEEKRQTGLWMKKTQKGETMMTGTWEGDTIMVFKNSYKTEEKHPDYIIKFKKKTPFPGSNIPKTVTGEDAPF
jgi:hypothetical protein